MMIGDMEMVPTRSALHIILGAALFSAQAAHAADAVYLGECNRARVVQQQSTIDTLVPHKRYEGIQRVQFGSNKTTSCEKNSLLTFTFTERSRNQTAVVYDMTRNDVLYGKQSGCPAVSVRSQTYTGTVTFSTRLAQLGEQCEVYIRAEWVHTGTTKPSDFWNRVISMENGAFVISQGVSKNGEYWSPLAFTGVNP